MEKIVYGKTLKIKFHKNRKIDEETLKRWPFFFLINNLIR